jgi:hypothetical protein
MARNVASKRYEDDDLKLQQKAVNYKRSREREMRTGTDRFGKK